ncbi:MAG: hypothetical protein KA436_12775 [Oligoflexales bacterium]|nr:hypothetical protein [Oligoflexales bacterium]
MAEPILTIKGILRFSSKARFLFKSLSLLLGLSLSSKLLAEPRPVEQSPFEASSGVVVSMPPLSLDLDSDLDASLSSWVSKLVDHPGIEVHIQKGQGPPPYSDLAGWMLTEEESQERSLAGYRSVNFSYQGTPICDLELKIVPSSLGSPLALGEVPQFDLTPSSVWPEQEAALKVAVNKFGVGTELYRASRCYLAKGSSLLAVWKMVLRSPENLSYEIMSDAKEIYKERALFFDLEDPINADIQAYHSNPRTSELEIFTIPTLGNMLTSEFFVTDTSASRSPVVQRASSENRKFIYDPKAIEFAEASSFAHATTMHNFFKSIGYVWTEKKPLILKLHSAINGTQNNALYQPGDAAKSGQPTIFIGDGDGKLLQNLPIDSDVVSHEFGHHIIYRTLKETSGEALILHEGLADYFSFSMSKDSCLGESICVEGQQNTCAIYGKCLRTGDNSIKYGDTTYLKLDPHLRGQMLSGFLLDLNKRLGADRMVQTVFNALGFLVYNSGFRHFLVSLMMADLKTETPDTCAIYEVATDRGLGTYLSNIDCHKPENINPPTLEIQFSKATTTGQQDTSQTKKRSSPFSCGASEFAVFMNGQGPGGGQAMPFLFIFCIPLFPMLIPRRKKKLS